jgi:virulence-associated protein VagC
MATARVIKSGNGQVVIVPKEFPIKTKRVEIFRDGREIVIKEIADLLKRQK